MSAMASKITGISIVYSAVCSSTEQRKHQSSASLAFVRGIHRLPVVSPHIKASNTEDASIRWRHHGLHERRHDMEMLSPLLGQLWKESTCHQWIPLTYGQLYECLCSCPNKTFNKQSSCWCFVRQIATLVNASRPELNCRYFADDVFKCVIAPKVSYFELNHTSVCSDV